MVKATGLPLAEGLDTAIDFPHTITSAIEYKLRINSFYELPKDKRPPRNLWDKPHRLQDFMDTIFDTDNSGNKSATYVEFDPDEIE